MKEKDQKRRLSVTTLIVFLGAVVFVGPLVLVWVSKLTLNSTTIGLDAASLVYGWPVITGLCIAAFLIMFRVPLAGFISEVRTIKAGGVVVQRAYVRPDETRALLKKWLGPADSENRQKLRIWLKTEVGWKESEASWVNSASDTLLNLAVQHFDIAQGDN